MKRTKWTQMTTAQLREATKEFDADFAFLKAKPLSAKGRRDHALARKRGRPQVGLGAKKVQVSVERGLLAETDQLAKKMGVTRSTLVARGLRVVVRRAQAA